ncbi:hypothetical protein QFZ89_007998 [Paraburkholderia youngii]
MLDAYDWHIPDAVEDALVRVMTEGADGREGTFAMEKVLTHIMRKRRVYDDLPLFECLRDGNLSALVKLGFMPGFAFFIMAFGDLNRYVLRRLPATNIYQQRVNAHTYEDDHHWPWFLEDLEKLGWSQMTTTTDALRALWSEETHHSRLLVYELCAILAGCSGVEKLAVIEAIEETGNVLFALTTRLADAVRDQTGIELRYMGAFHFALESGHLQNGGHVDLAHIELNCEEQDRCIALVDRVFDAFAGWSHEAVAQIELAAKAGNSVDCGAAAQTPFHI